MKERIAKIKTWAKEHEDELIGALIGVAVSATAVAVTTFVLVKQNQKRYGSGSALGTAYSSQGELSLTDGMTLDEIEALMAEEESLEA